MGNRKKRTPRNRLRKINGHDPKRIPTINKDGESVLDFSPDHSTNQFHSPTCFAPKVQWTPATGVNRYHYERLKTPEHQKKFFMGLNIRYSSSPPRVMSPELRAEMVRCATMIKQGKDPVKVGWPEVAKEIAKCEITAKTDDGKWIFNIKREALGQVLVDKIGIRHVDQRTMPDWDLALRTRCWLVSDLSPAQITMPDLPSSVPLEAYNNLYANEIIIVVPCGMSSVSKTAQAVINEMKVALDQQNAIIEELASSDKVSDSLKKKVKDSIALVSGKEIELNPRVNDLLDYRCSKCLGKNVEAVYWVRLQSLEIMDEAGKKDDDLNCWCLDCDDHTTLIKRGQSSTGQEKPKPS